MNDVEIDTKRRVALAACAVIIAVGLGDLVRPACGHTMPPVPFPDDEVPPVTYALTPYDVGSLLRAREGRADGRIGALPAQERPDAPVMTRVNNPTQWLMPGARDAVSLSRLPDGWTQVRWATASSPGAKGPLALRNARVFLNRDGQRRRCTQVGIDRFRCSDRDWGFVGPNTLTISGRKQTCIWAHPLDGATTIISYGTLDPEATGGVDLWTALDDSVATSGGPVDISVRWGDATTDVHHAPQTGWKKTVVQRPDASATFEVTVRAEHVGRRHFCYRLPVGGGR